jgi:hypothetical protein
LPSCWGSGEPGRGYPPKARKSSAPADERHELVLARGCEAWRVRETTPVFGTPHPTRILVVGRRARFSRASSLLRTVATLTETAALARKRHQVRVAARRAPHPGETLAQLATLEVGTQLPRNKPGQRTPGRSPLMLAQERLDMVRNHAIEVRLLGSTTVTAEGSETRTCHTHRCSAFATDLSEQPSPTRWRTRRCHLRQFHGRSQVQQDPPDHVGIGEERQHVAPAAAVVAQQHVDAEYPAHQLRPAVVRPPRAAPLAAWRASSTQRG